MLLLTYYILLGVTIVLQFVHYMHMFQLGGYHASTQIKWYAQNPVLVIGRMLLFGITFGIFAISNQAQMVVVGIFLMMLAVTISLPRKAKKKLVFTPRVIRMCVTSAVLCSAVVLAIIFVPAIINTQKWLAFLGIFTPLICIIANIVNSPIEKAINNWYINDAKRIIDSHKNLVTIGITGSYGKTSTKYYLNSLLSAKYNVLMTPESYNTTMGVVKTVRQSLSGTHEVFICEMGAKGVGEIKEICDIVKPRHSMITSIGEQHLETFKSIENIIKTKFEIADCISDGTVFLNYDNSFIREHKINKNVISYGIGGDNDKAYFATDISVSEKGSQFTLHAPNGEAHVFQTALIGQHNVENIVGAIAIAHFMGISFGELYLPVKRLESVPHRMQILGGGNRVVIDDAFNSNPSGAKAALDVLKMLDGTRFLVTPGMIELGAKAYQLNKELGENAADCCDYAVLVGEKQAPPIKDGLLEKGFPIDKIYVAKNLSDAMHYVDNMQVGEKKVILLENDLPDNY